VKENFFRRPQGAVELAADALRVIGALSVIAALVGWTVTDAGVIALVLGGLMLPRLIGVHPVFDVVFQVVLLIAGWSNVFGLYESLTSWDLVVHFTCTAVAAILGYLLLVRLEIALRPDDPRFTMAISLVTLTTLGLAASAVWEMVEWLGWTYIDDAIVVAYSDTIGDMAVGGLGALLGGVLLALLPLGRHRGGGVDDGGIPEADPLPDGA
jgi:hypothetical protein